MLVLKVLQYCKWYVSQSASTQMHYTLKYRLIQQLLIIVWFFTFIYLQAAKSCVTKTLDRLQEKINGRVSSFHELLNYLIYFYGIQLILLADYLGKLIDYLGKLYELLNYFMVCRQLDMHKSSYPK